MDLYFHYGSQTSKVSKRPCIQETNQFLQGTPREIMLGEMKDVEKIENSRSVL